MLPLQFIIAMVVYAFNERMARRIEYLLEEGRVMREVYTETTGRKRISFTDEQRRRLAIQGKALTPQEREGCCQIVRPSAILAWFRLFDLPVEVTGKLGRHQQRQEAEGPRKHRAVAAVPIDESVVNEQARLVVLGVGGGFGLFRRVGGQEASRAVPHAFPLPGELVERVAELGAGAPPPGG